ncbi:DUF3810 domain-containing protein [Christensenellaceae bacterium OttesenSCG-928-L17]|nr:DUF3810 domain-containing protein [Christensenellaceae bacterium OttesenSCG-928-L17]
MKKKKPLSWRHECRRLLWLLLLLPPLILPRLASKFPDIVERVYSRAVYPVVSVFLNALFSVFPFSFAEILLYFLIIFVPASLIVCIYRAVRKKASWLQFVRLCITYCIIACFAFNAFYVFWGLNYSRPQVSTLLELDVRERPVEELEALCHSLAKDAALLREQVEEDENGVFHLSESTRTLLKKIPEAYRNLGSEISMFNRYIASPKPVLASEGLSYAGISGIFIPFTGEANVNTHQHDLLLLSSAAHESAHAMGIARENEANFVSYLACSASNDPAIAYSGVMLALVHCGNALYHADQEKYSTLYRSYSEGMQADFIDYNRYWNAYEGPIQETASEVNDNYLKFNQQESGIKSYGEMVDLMLAWFEKEQ